MLTPEAREHLNEKQRQYDQARKDKKREYARLWYRRNKERLKTRRQAHPNYKRRMRSANEQYRKAKRNAYIYTHDIEIQRRIDEIYDRMRELNDAGGDYVVDHIIPIQNPLCCGLHVPWNLSVITRKANSVKGNDFDPDHDFLPKKTRSEPGS